MSNMILPYPWYKESVILNYIKDQLIPNEKIGTNIYNLFDVLAKNDKTNYNFDIIYTTSIETSKNWINIEEINLSKLKPRYVKKGFSKITEIESLRYTYEIESINDILTIIKNNTISNFEIKTHIFGVEYNIDFSKTRVLWLNSDFMSACGYMLGRTFLNRYYYKNHPLFIHKTLINTTERGLNLIKLTSNTYYTFFSQFGINEHILCYDLEAIAEWIQNQVNPLLQKNNIPLLDGLIYINSLNYQTIVLIKDIKSPAFQIVNSYIYTNNKEIFPQFSDDMTVFKFTEICKNFYYPPKIIIKSNIENFRNFLTRSITDLNTNRIDSEKAEALHKTITTIITTGITNAMRPLIYKAIFDINLLISKYGKLICAGGDAINIGIKIEDRKISPDIDTKFLLKKLNSLNEKTFFKNLLETREVFWYGALEEVLKKMEFFRFLYRTLCKSFKTIRTYFSF